MTVHEAAARKLLDDMEKQPGGIESLLQAARHLRDRDHWSAAYQDAIGQPFRVRGDWPLPQVAAFAWAHSAVCDGRVAQIDIGLGWEPSLDREREWNAAKLRGLPAPFVADVNMDQQCGDFDGLLRWDEPVIADLVTGRDADGEFIVEPTTIPPGEVALEIGSTAASRTALHFAEGGVARWPYGHDAVRVFVWVAEPTAYELGATLAAGIDRYAEAYARPEDLTRTETTDA